VPLADELKSSEVSGHVHPWRRANFGRPDGKNPLGEATVDSHIVQNLRYQIAFHISFSYTMLFLESFAYYTKLAQRRRVQSVHVLSLVLESKHSDWLAFICSLCGTVQHADGWLYYAFQMFLGDVKCSGRAVSFIPTALLAGLLLKPHGKVPSTIQAWSEQSPMSSIKTNGQLVPIPLGLHQDGVSFC